MYNISILIDDYIIQGIKNDFINQEFWKIC